MKIRAALYNANHLKYGLVTIPFPIPPDQYDSTIGMLESLDIGDPLARDCTVEEIQGSCPILKRLEGTGVNVDELDYLVKRLDSFADSELAQFQGMAYRLGTSDMTDLINLTFCCQQATVITDFSDLEQIGRDHYLNLHGGCASMEELERLDARRTALDLILNDTSGQITPYGVVYDNGMRLEQLYDDCHFPAYHQHTPQWNKHMVKRILENERYLGAGGYPRLVEDRGFLTVRLRRESQTTYTPCPPALAPIREKAVCAVCGAGMKRDTKRHGHPRWHCQNPGCGHSLYMDDELLVKQVEERVRRLAQMPLRFKAPTAAAPSMDAVRIENELKLCFNRAELNPDYIKTLIFAAAAERYRELPDPAPRQKGIERGKQAQENPLDGKTLWDFFDVAVSAVRMGQKCLELELAANVTIQTREEEPA